MSAIPWQTTGFYTRLRREIEDLFRKVIHEPWGYPLSESSWRPAIDFYETETEYVIEADLPGVAAENVKVTIDGPLLTICGTRHCKRELEDAHGVWCERESGRFCRTLLLGQPVDRDGMSIENENGIFHIRLPKRLSFPPD